MSAPERIWIPEAVAWDEFDLPDLDIPTEVEYVRADILADRDARIAELEAIARAATQAPLRATRTNRVIYSYKGKLDEVVTDGGAYLENLGGKSWYLEMKRADGSEFSIWFNGKITMTEECPAPAHREPAQAASAHPPLSDSPEASEPASGQHSGAAAMRENPIRSGRCPICGNGHTGSCRPNGRDDRPLIRDWDDGA